MKIPKQITIATAIASFVVFAATYLAVAESGAANSIFLDSDQDGLTNQEEKSLGTNPDKADSDGDGYSDGKEISSGYNPLKPAPGDQLLVSAIATPKKISSPGVEAASSEIQDADETAVAGSPSSESDESNLTDQMVDEFMKLTLDKSGQSETFFENPSYTEEDLDRIVQSALSQNDVSQNLPEVSDAELKILSPVEDKNLNADEIKEKQKKEIEKYLSSLAFIFATNAPFPVEEPGNFAASLETESDNLFSSIVSGDKEKIASYAEKCEKGIEQVKNLETPFVMKDIHKSALQLSLYVLSFKDSVAVGSGDPIKSLAALTSLQTTSESVLNLQSRLQDVMDEYGIKTVEMKP